MILARMERTFELRRQEVMDKENIEVQLRKLREDLNSKEVVVFSTEEINDFYFNKLVSIADMFDLTIGNLKQDKLLPFKRKDSSILMGLFEVPISITIEGSYSGLLGFMNHLEKYQKVINLISYNLGVVSMEPMILNSTIKLRFFILKEDEE